MTPNAAKEFLRDINKNKQIDLDDIKTNIKSFHNFEELVPALQKQKEDIKNTVFKVITDFHNELLSDTARFSALSKEEKNIIKLGRELGILEKTKEMNLLEKVDWLPRGLRKKIGEFIEDQKIAGIEDIEIKKLIINQFKGDLINSAVTAVQEKRKAADHTDYILTNIRPAIDKIHVMLDEVLSMHPIQTQQKSEEIKKEAGGESELIKSAQQISASEISKIYTIPSEASTSAEEPGWESEIRKKSEKEKSKPIIAEEENEEFLQPEFDKPLKDLENIIFGGTLPKTDIIGSKVEAIGKRLATLDSEINNYLERTQGLTLLAANEKMNLVSAITNLLPVNQSKDLIHQLPDLYQKIVSKSEVLSELVKTTDILDEGLGPTKEVGKPVKGIPAADEQRINDLEERISTQKDKMENMLSKIASMALSDTEKEILMGYINDKISLLEAKRGLLNNIKKKAIAEEEVEVRQQGTSQDNLVGQTLSGKIDRSLPTISVEDAAMVLPQEGGKSEIIETITDLENLVDEVEITGEENGGEWPKKELLPMLEKINAGLDEGKKLLSGLPENSPYQNSLKDKIDRLEAKKAILEEKQKDLELQTKEEEARARGERPNMEMIKPMRAELASQREKVAELMTSHPDYFTPTEQEGEKNKVPETIADLENLIDEVEVTGEENGGERPQKELIPMLVKATSGLDAGKKALVGLSQNSIYTKPLQDKIDTLEAKKILLETKQNELELLAKEEEARARGERPNMEMIKPMRAELASQREKVAELMTSHPDYFTPTEQEGEKNKVPETIADLENLIDEVEITGEENGGEWPKKELLPMLEKINAGLDEGKKLLSGLPENSPYQNSLKDKINRLEAKKTLLEEKQKDWEMIDKEKEIRAEAQKKPIGIMKPLKGELARKKGKIEELMASYPDYFTDIEKNAEKNKVPETIADLENLVDEIEETGKDNKGIWNKDEIDFMLSRIEKLLPSAKSIQQGLSETSPYRLSLQDKIGTLEARRAMLELKGEKYMTEKRVAEKLTAPQENMQPIGTKFLDMRRQTNDVLEAHPELFSEQDILDMESMKSLNALIEISSVEDEFATINKNNQGTWRLEEVNPILARIEKLLPDAKTLHEGLPQSDKYKKYLEDRIPVLEAKRDLLKSKQKEREPVVERKPIEEHISNIPNKNKNEIPVASLKKPKLETPYDKKKMKTDVQNALGIVGGDQEKRKYNGVISELDLRNKADSIPDEEIANAKAALRMTTDQLQRNKEETSEILLQSPTIKVTKEDLNNFVVSVWPIETPDIKYNCVISPSYEGQWFKNDVKVLSPLKDPTIISAKPRVDELISGYKERREIYWNMKKQSDANKKKVLDDTMNNNGKVPLSKKNEMLDRLSLAKDSLNIASNTGLNPGIISYIKDADGSIAQVKANIAQQEKVIQNKQLTFQIADILDMFIDAMPAKEDTDKLTKLQEAQKYLKSAKTLADQLKDPKVTKVIDEYTIAVQKLINDFLPPVQEPQYAKNEILIPQLNTLLKTELYAWSKASGEMQGTVARFLTKILEPKLRKAGDEVVFNKYNRYDAQQIVEQTAKILREKYTGMIPLIIAELKNKKNPGTTINKNNLIALLSGTANTNSLAKK